VRQFWILDFGLDKQNYSVAGIEDASVEKENQQGFREEFHLLQDEDNS